MDRGTCGWREVRGMWFVTYIHILERALQLLSGEQDRVGAGRGSPWESSDERSWVAVVAL